MFYQFVVSVVLIQARAAIEAINGLYPTNKVQIIYIGNTFSATYLAQVKNYVKDKEFGINVISKSGTTTETSVAFRIFKELLEETKGKEVAQRRIVATTDAHKGALKTLSDQEGYTEFVVPDDIGGRYSVLTAVGLFPIAMAGIDVDAMLKGAKDAQDKYNNPDLLTNTSQVFIMYLNGGNSYLVNLKVKKEKVSYLQVVLSQLTFIHQDSSSRKVLRFYSKLY